MLLTKEICWNILRQDKYTLPEVMELLGDSPNQIDKALEEIKQADKHDTSNYFALSFNFGQMAYLRLVELGEIDGTEMFNLQTGKYASEGEAALGDIGMKGNQTFRYSHPQWIFMF